MFRPRRRWRPRFTLKAFMVFCLMWAGAVAWVSHNYREYCAEQQLIEGLAKTIPTGDVMSISINGENRYVRLNAY